MTRNLKRQLNVDPGKKELSHLAPKDNTTSPFQRSYPIALRSSSACNPMYDTGGLHDL
uniref:PML-orf3 n=1 Tax=Methanohalophilus mahii TaxID=2176 RepID=Q6QWE5_9EURY|nr:pML-orf3 [Methanohalophilus mahii]